MSDKLRELVEVPKTWYKEGSLVIIFILLFRPLVTIISHLFCTPRFAVYHSLYKAFPKRFPRLRVVPVPLEVTPYSKSLFRFFFFCYYYRFRPDLPSSRYWLRCHGLPRVLCQARAYPYVSPFYVFFPLICVCDR
jgi:hypothetical protein